MMELSDLQVFRAVVEAGGVNRAAARLHRVQSNVTTRIRNLEEELGVELFLRVGRGLQLAPPGRVLLDYAHRLLALADEARGALHASAPRGTLRLGAMESTAAARLPAPLNEYCARYPDVTIELRTGAPRELLQQVLAGELDAVLVAEPVADARLATQVAFREELVIVSASRHAPIRSPRDLASSTILAFHPGCPHRARLEEWFDRYRVVPERVVEMSSYHAMLGCAVAGMGIALMPRSVLDTYTERGELGIHPLGGRFRSALTLLAWRKDWPQARIAALADVLTATRPQRSAAKRGTLVGA